MASDHMRFPRSREEVRESVLENLGEDREFMTCSEVDAIISYHQELEQSEG